MEILQALSAFVAALTPVAPQIIFLLFMVRNTYRIFVYSEDGTRYDVFQGGCTELVEHLILLLGGWYSGAHILPQVIWGAFTIISFVGHAVKHGKLNVLTASLPVKVLGAVIAWVAVQGLLIAGGWYAPVVRAFGGHS